ncbi:hypothetical protein HMPREF3038_01509 [Akkermansia sp. KLE1797]|nr:hypothetical protein HMPREF3038_01509 [Akkermansia sp. KLE1797]KXU53443.1 hypothetical protein HMPREF3039_02386 [Akkermansia sp. KLE1798]KZA04548.1 hypothetical protein HMPREF1326_01771 [Akkermansia sp. KLE1605]
MLQHFTMLESRQIFSGGFFVSVKTGGTGPDDPRPVRLPCYPLWIMISRQPFHRYS